MIKPRVKTIPFQKSRLNRLTNKTEFIMYVYKKIESDNCKKMFRYDGAKRLRHLSYHTCVAETSLDIMSLVMGQGGSIYFLITIYFLIFKLFINSLYFYSSSNFKSHCWTQATPLMEGLSLLCHASEARKMFIYLIKIFFCCVYITAILSRHLPTV